MDVLTDIAREQLKIFQKFMISTKEKGCHPNALLILPDGSQFLIIMEWKDEQEREIVLAKLVGTVTAARALAVVMTSTCKVLMTRTNTADWVLLATIYVPTLKPYTIGIKYAMVDGEPVFGDEVSSADISIKPMDVGSLWPETKQGSIH